MTIQQSNVCSPEGLNTPVACEQQGNDMVKVRFAHIWPSMRDCMAMGREPKVFYHVVCGDYAAGSTVTIENLLSLGLRVEVVE